MPVQIPKVWKCMPFLSISIWISNFVQHRSQVCLVIISWRMWRQMAQKAAARVSVRGVLQNNCSIARICSNTNITSEQFFVRVPRMVPRQDAGTRSSLTLGKLPKNIFKTICTLSSMSRRWVLCPVFFLSGATTEERKRRVLLTARRDLGEKRACRLCVRTSAR